MAEEMGERTEQPTSKRRGDARRKGQVAKSQDLGSAIDLAGGFFVVLFLGAPLTGTLAGIVRHMLDARASGHGLVAGEIGDYTAWVGLNAALAVAPFLVVLVLVSALAQFVQVGWLVTLYPLMPKFEKLNPMTGAKRLFSKRSVIKSLVNAVKLGICTLIAFQIIRRHFDAAISLPLLDLLPAAMLILRIITTMVIWLLVLMFVMGLIDLLYQRWQQTQDMKMTKQEVKDEHRSMEGDMETKGRRLRMARSMLMQRMHESVPTADVVVTNPTHYSVALKYDSGSMKAPRVVAKGADELAIRIRQIAAAHKIPIVEKPPLARALYHGVDVGREVPAQHYEAVAEVLAYVYRLAKKAA